MKDHKRSFIKSVLTHRAVVKHCMNKVIDNLEEGAEDHDMSKLDKKLDLWTEATLPNAKVDSPEYEEGLRRTEYVRILHYGNNDHHPEHYRDGIYGMSLMSLMEMLADWKASSMRSDMKSLDESLEYFKERFEMDSTMYGILQNTIDELGW